MADEKKTVKVTADIDIQTNAQQMQKARAEIAALNREIEDLKKQEEELRKIQDRTPIQQREYKNVLSSITSRQRQVKDLSSKASKSISVVGNNSDASKYIKDAQQSRKELTGLEKEEAELYARIREEKKKKNEELRKELSSLEGEEKSFNISSNSGSYAPLSKKEKDAQKAYEKAFKAEQKRQLEDAKKEAYYRKKAKSMSVKDIAAAKEKYGNVSKRTWSKTNFTPNMDAINKSAADRAAAETREAYGLSKYYSFKNREKRQSNYGSLSKSGQKTLSGYLDSIAKIDEKADEALKVIWEKMAKEQGVSYESFLGSKLSKTSGLGSHLTAKEIKAQKELVEKEQARVNRERALQEDLRNPNAYNASREAIQRRSNIKFGDNKTLPAYDKTKKIIEDSYRKGRAKLTHEQIQNIFDAVLNESDLKVMSGALKQGAPIDATKSFITRNGYGTFVGNDGHIVVGGYKNTDGNLVPAQSYKINSDNYLAKINAQGFKLGKKGQASLYDIDEFYGYINDLIAIEAKKAGPEAKKEVQRLTEVANDVIAMVTEAIGNTNLDSIKNPVLGKFSATEKGISGADFEPNAPFVRDSAFYKAMQTRFSQSPSDFDMGLTEQNTEKVPQYDPEKVRKDEIKKATVQAEAEAESNNRNNEFGKFMKEDLTKWLTEVFKTGGANALNDAIQLVINQIKEQLKGNVQEGQVGTISFGGDIVDAGFNDEGKMLTVTNHEKFDEDNRDMVYNEEFLAKEKEEIVATEDEIEANTEKFSVTMKNVLATIIAFVRQVSDASDSLDDKQALGKIGDRLERRLYKGEGNTEKSLDQNFQEAFNRMARMITTGKVLQGNWVREAEKNGTTPIVEMQKTIEGIEDIDERDEYTQQVISAMSAYQRFKEALGKDGENIENAIKAFFEGGGREIEEIYNQYKMFSNNPKMLKRFQDAVMIETTPRGWGANRASASQNIGAQQVMPKDKSLKTADLSPKERFIQLYGQGQAVLGTFATTDLDVGLQRANKRLEEAKNKQVVSEEKIAKAKEVLANMQEKYGTKTTRFGTKIDFKTPLWADDTDLTEKQIAQQVGEDERAYKKAQHIISGSTNNDAEIANLEEKIKLIKEAIEAQKKMYDVLYFGQSDKNLDTENQATAKKLGLIKDETTAEQEKTTAIEKTTQALQQQKTEESSLPEPDYDSLYEDMTASLQQNTQAVEQNAQITKQGEDKKQAEAEETAKAEKNKKEAVDEVSDALRKQAEEEAKAAEEAKKARIALSGKADFSEIDDLPWDTSDEDRPAVQAAIDEQNAKWRKDMHRESQMEWIRNPANRGFGVGMDSGEILDTVSDKPAEENLDWKKGIREYEAATQNIVKALGQIYESQQKIKQIQEEINNLQSNENGLNKEQLALLETQKAAEENKLAQAQAAYEAAGRRKEESGIREQVQGRGSAFPTSLARQVQQIDYYAESQLREIKANVDAKNTYQTKGSSTKWIDKSITSYLSQYKQILKLQEQIDAGEKRLAGTGLKGESADNARSVVNMRKRLLAQMQAESPMLDLEKGTLNGQQLSEEQLVKLKKEIAVLDANHGIQLEKNNVLQKQSVGLVQQIANGFKASFRNLTDYSLAYTVIGKIRMAYSQLISYAEQLNASMVDLQIASGLTYNNIKSMMLDFNDLAKTVGKSTLEVANAANDWLRAGYEGQEASELTNASMHLSTLGMIDSSQATSYLISVLKGWKIEASEVMEVVDKLTVTICSVCRAIGIGHKLKSR